jgi:IS30 family transposase
MILSKEILFGKRWCKKMVKKKIAETLGISVNTVKAITNVALELGLERDNCTSEQLANISAMAALTEALWERALNENTNGLVRQYLKNCTVAFAS